MQAGKGLFQFCLIVSLRVYSLEQCPKEMFKISPETKEYRPIAGYEGFPIYNTP